MTEKLLTPQEARALSKTQVQNSKEYLDLIQEFKKAQLSWDGTSPIKLTKKLNPLVNEVFCDISRQFGWMVEHDTRKQSDMKGETWDEPIFKITEARNYITDCK